jgi:hypothetical protein
LCDYTLQEAASSILNQAKRRSGESGRALFESFARLSDQLIRTCMWQPPNDRRVSRCSAFKEFKHLVNMLPVDVQVPVQVSQFTLSLEIRVTIVFLTALITV